MRSELFSSLGIPMKFASRRGVPGILHKGKSLHGMDRQGGMSIRFGYHARQLIDAFPCEFTVAQRGWEMNRIEVIAFFIEEIAEIHPLAALGSCGFHGNQIPQYP